MSENDNHYTGRVLVRYHRPGILRGIIDFYRAHIVAEWKTGQQAAARAWENRPLCDHQHLDVRLWEVRHAVVPAAHICGACWSVYMAAFPHRAIEKEPAQRKRGPISLAAYIPRNSEGARVALDAIRAAAALIEDTEDHGPTVNEHWRVVLPGLAQVIGWSQSAVIQGEDPAAMREFARMIAANVPKVDPIGDTDE